MQSDLKHIQRKTGTTFVYVTHDQEEALTMSDRIAVVHRGVCVQCDAPEVLFRRPKTRFVASFFRGSNVLEAAVEEVAGGHVHVWVSVAIRAQNLRVGPRAAECRVQLRATLLDVVYRARMSTTFWSMEDGQRLTVTSTRREAEDGGLPAAQHRAGFDPGGVDIGEVEGMDELAVGRIAGVGHQVRLGKAGRGDVPAIGLDGDVVLEQRAGLGAAIEAALQPGLLRLEATVERPGADGADLAFHRGGNENRRFAHGSHRGSCQVLSLEEFARRKRIAEANPWIQGSKIISDL